MNDETTRPDLREQLVKALAAEHYRRARQGILASPEIHSAAMADAALAVVQPELDRLTERIPYREGETEEQYLERQIARWRSEAWQARGKLREAEVERNQLKAAIGPAVNHDEPCGNREPADRRLTCTLPEGHVTHYAAGSGTVWRCICAPTADQAAVARIRALHVNEHGSCGGCMDVLSVSWPCPTITALDQPEEGTR